MNAHSLTVYRSRRLMLEERIKELIDLLDVLDGDCDFEPDLAGFDERCMDDREGDDERDDDGDRQDFDGSEADCPAPIWGGMEDYRPIGITLSPDRQLVNSGDI